ncbi:hypothetical protein D7030_15005 [Flavobacteriaceae bacterium AU392]|nr:hypothetical protein D1817_03485 [Flavobacteriaceae bacterium]RKM81603.1 hypothetical protein D7030_15005 [Flavobacteriaceae bacterium AU392]
MKFFSTLFTFIICCQIASSQQNGLYKEYHDNGQLKTEGEYLYKKRIGDWKNYYDNGQVSSLYSYTNGKQNKESTAYFKDGSLKYITKKEGNVYITRGYYDDSGKLKFEREHTSGYFKQFFENGQLLVETNYLNNQLSGTWKRYYENGNIEWEVVYTKGYKNGTYKCFYKSGQLKLEGNTREGKKEGEEKRYSENGILKWKGDYKKGKFNKLWVKYDVNQNEVESIKFKNGKVIKGKVVPTLIDIPEGSFERVPLYPGCEEDINNETRKKCMSDKITQLIFKNYNLNLARNTGLYGVQRTKAYFKIDKTGSIIDIKIEAPHSILKVEAERVIKLLPKMKPGIQWGEPVTVPYAFPIVFRVQ